MADRPEWPVLPRGIRVAIDINLDVAEIAKMPPPQRAALLQGIAKVIEAGNP